MSFDVKKLSPVKDWEPNLWGGAAVARFENETNAEFAYLARQAFDVMVSRGWHAKQHSEGWWYVWDWDFPASIIRAGDPFTALVDADKWYKDNMEKTNDA